MTNNVERRVEPAAGDAVSEDANNLERLVAAPAASEAAYNVDWLVGENERLAAENDWLVGENERLAAENRRLVAAVARERGMAAVSSAGSLFLRLARPKVTARSASITSSVADLTQGERGISLTPDGRVCSLRRCALEGIPIVSERTRAALPSTPRGTSASDLSALATPLSTPRSTSVSDAASVITSVTPDVSSRLSAASCAMSSVDEPRELGVALRAGPAFPPCRVSQKARLLSMRVERV